MFYCDDTPKEKIIPPKDPSPGGGCDCDYLETEIAKKQDRLTAGNGISIDASDIISLGVDPVPLSTVQGWFV